MRSLIILICLVLSLILKADTESEKAMNSLWVSAVTALKDQRNAEARDLFGQWVREAESNGLESPEAYYNLALADWSLGEIAPAITYFVKSASLVSSPLENWRNLQLLSRLEKEAGIKESATSQTSFRLKMLLNSNVTTLFFLVGFWMFVLLSVWRWWRAERGLATASLRWVLTGPSCLWLVAAIGGINLKMGHSYAVLTDKSEVALFQTPDDKEKLIELPAGTIVESGKEENGFVQVIEPVSGWARHSQINPLQFPEIEAPEVAFFKN